MSASIAWNSPDAFTLTAFRCPPFRLRHSSVVAAEAAKLHPRVGDWIETAPILICALRGREFYQGLYELAVQGGRLKDALRVCHIPTVMRRASAAEAEAWFKRPAWRETFPAIGDSELAQILAARPEGGKARDDFTWNLWRIWKPRQRLRYDGPVDLLAAWAVRMALVPRDQWKALREALDFCEANPFDLSWSLARLGREHSAWVARLNNEATAVAEALKSAKTEAERRRALKLELEICFGHRPLDVEFNGVAVTALNSAAKLMREGQRMKHCVGAPNFQTALRRGSAVFYHLEAGGERSTLEIRNVRGVDLIGQHCGPCNNRPHAVLENAARQLLHFITLNKPRDAT